MFLFPRLTASRGLLVIAVFCVVYPCLGLKSQGHVTAPVGTSFTFIDRFCFSNTGSGTGEFRVSFDSQNFATRFVLFDDTVWPKISRSMSCSQVLDEALADPGHHRFVTDLAQGKLVNEKFPVIDRVRPHYWFLVVLNCQDSVDLDYKIEWLNIPNGWEQEFSFDAQGSITLYTVFLSLTVIVCAVHLFVHRHARINGNPVSELPVVKLVSMALISFVVGDVLMILHLITFAENGVGLESLEVLSLVMHSCGQALVLVLLLIVGQGWTVNQVQLKKRTAVFVCSGAFVLSHIALLTWQFCCRSRENTYFVYDSTFGIVVLAIRFIIYIFFQRTFSATFSHEYDPFKRRFFGVFGVGSTIWFVGVPVAVGIATLLDPWVRAKAVVTMWLSLDFMTCTGIVFCVWPSKASDIFQVSINYDILGESGYEDVL